MDKSVNTANNVTKLSCFEPIGIIFLEVTCDAENNLDSGTSPVESKTMS